ncbi:MAG: hypothetical protein UX31_C0006G0005 [Candidatus Nomurabacteria bacterium GW2011_GWA1_46_11]|uniref:Uncharacterized protein n=2 Tax=Parcubacteria group TaxID=1794811 RepID=A0A1G1YY67_9BACT|nr:MAG: hypothetical protein UX29_C0004G0016 [Parcubacteria group bacterium GW2011_GWA2_46_10]KKU22093.1 MAG: hypothetical protein UX31_C0006G0005 [Candidatus Nomurabacteria bacterium GW2011_GWA1_46_11]OGY56357.1 MAG: hypothetical protein A2119_02430 [Candidatus Colwellbacteria bacterium GWA2_46_10]
MKTGNNDLHRVAAGDPRRILKVYCRALSDPDVKTPAFMSRLDNFVNFVRSNLVTRELILDIDEGTEDSDSWGSPERDLLHSWLAISGGNVWGHYRSLELTYGKEGAERFVSTLKESAKIVCDHLIKELNKPNNAQADIGHEELIRSLALIVEQGVSKQDRYQIVINDDYNNALWVNGECWRCLYQVADGMFPDASDNKGFKDYLNFSKQCALYSKRPYLPTRILRVKDAYLVPAIDLKIITQKTFVTRRNKQS